MRSHVVIESVKGSNSPRRRWRLFRPDFGEKDFYRQSVSFNSFFFNSGKNKNKDKSYMVFWEEEYRNTEEINRRFEIPEDLPIVEVVGIREFYKIIGYDYKKRKYV